MLDNGELFHYVSMFRRRKALASLTVKKAELLTHLRYRRTVQSSPLLLQFASGFLSFRKYTVYVAFFPFFL